MELLVKRLSEHATIPTYAHLDDAGMDLYASESCEVKALSQTNIPTGLVFAIPEGYVGLVWGKSGLAFKHGITPIGGVIDAGYRGELRVAIANVSHTDYRFERGEKVAQMLIQKIEHPQLREVHELSETARGTGGFGSTGA